MEDEDFLIEYLTVRCEIISKEYPNSLVIPQMFVFQVNDDYFVFYYRDGLAQKKKVKIDNPSAREIRIIEGILANEIILEPEGLKTGMKVILAE